MMLPLLFGVILLFLFFSLNIFFYLVGWVGGAMCVSGCGLLCSVNDPTSGFKLAVGIARLDWYHRCQIPYAS